MTDPNLLDDLSHMDDDGLIAAVRRACQSFDPVPVGLVERMVTVTRDVAREDPDLELELMLVMERFAELVGTRGGARSYTLRFGGDGVDMLVRVSVADEEGKARLDGWLVPAVPGPIEVREVGGDGRCFGGRADDTGRFEFPDLTPGLYRMSLSTDDERSIATPAFEI